MKVILKNEPNIVFEAAMLLTDYASDRNLTDIKEQLQKKTRAEAKILDGCFDKIIEFTELVRKKTELDRDVLEYLFAYREELDSCLAFYILHEVFTDENSSFPEDIEKIKNINKARFFANMYSMLLDRFPELDSQINISNYGEFINFISILPIAADLKWELCSFYNNFEQIRTLLAAIMARVGKLYLDEYALVKHHTDWYTANHKMNSALDQEKFARDTYPDLEGRSPDKLYLVPSVALTDRTSYRMRYMGEVITDFLYVGVLYIPLQGIGPNPFDERKLCRALKLLGDSSKFEIIRLVAEGPKYGLQLAQALEISTATISHHMSQLQELNLVKIERDANRIYYTANREMLAEIKDDLTKVFYLADK